MTAVAKSKMPLMTLTIVLIALHTVSHTSLMASPHICHCVMIHSMTGWSIGWIAAHISASRVLNASQSAPANSHADCHRAPIASMIGCKVATSPFHAWPSQSMNEAHCCRPVSVWVNQ